MPGLVKSQPGIRKRQETNHSKTSEKHSTSSRESQTPGRLVESWKVWKDETSDHEFVYQHVLSATTVFNRFICVYCVYSKNKQ